MAEDTPPISDAPKAELSENDKVRLGLDQELQQAHIDRLAAIRLRKKHVADEKKSRAASELANLDIVRAEKLIESLEKRLDAIPN